MPQLTSVPTIRPQRPARVLLVEDDYELRRMVAAVLRYDGYEVTELSNGRQLADYVLERQSAPAGEDEADVILSDICMPEQSGFAALERLRKTGVDTPVVFMTAFPEPFTSQRAHELRAVTVLEKPFDLDDLRMIIMNLVPPGKSKPRCRRN
jgi:CheY-like chemotaxis protein